MITTIVFYSCIALSIILFATAIDKNTKRVDFLPLLFAFMMLLGGLTAGVAEGTLHVPFIDTLLPGAWLLLIGVMLTLGGFYLLLNTSPRSENIGQYMIFGFWKGDDFIRIAFVGLLVCYMALASLGDALTTQTVQAAPAHQTSQPSSDKTHKSKPSRAKHISGKKTHR